MRRFTAAALAAALLLCARGATAQTLADLSPPLATEVSTRLGALTGKLTGVQKKQKSALTKASKALATATDDVGKTIADAVKTASALEPAFAADPTIPVLLDPLVFAVLSVVTDRRVGLDRSIAALPDGKTKTAVQKAAATADAAEVQFAAATTRVARLKALQQKYAAVASGEKRAAKAGAEIVATTSLDVDVEKQHLHVPGLPVSIYAINFVSAPSGKATIHVGGTTGDVRHNISLEVSDPGTGAHDVSIGPGSNYASVPGAGLLPAVSGSVNFTTWDPDHGKAAGSFTATFSNGTITVHLTGGTFANIAVQTQ